MNDPLSASPSTPLLQVYVVGGAVRDALLGLPQKDRDWVVVGSTPEAMVARGFRPVGKDFPVFLHPDTQEEYALARTERKTAHGYRGFAVHASPEVTLEEDLARRDLTINAIASDAQGRLIDPYGGQRDLEARILRHVTAAFAEDPVRILRIARFAARFTDFSIAPETMALMRDMVAGGEVDHLVPERVWQEVSRGLMESAPSRMFEVLRACGALARILPELDALWGVPQSAQHHPEIDTGLHVMHVIDMAARLGAPLEVRYACLCHDLGKAETPRMAWPHHPGHEAAGLVRVRTLSQRLRVPVHCRELAEVVTREHGHIHGCLHSTPADLVALLERCDAFRQPQRFRSIVLACACDARGRQGHAKDDYPQERYLLDALDILLTLDAGALARTVQREMAAPEAPARPLGACIRERLTAARVHLLTDQLPSPDRPPAAG